MKNKRFIKVDSSPATWIEVSNEISEEKAKRDYMRKKNKTIESRWTATDQKRKIDFFR